MGVTEIVGLLLSVVDGVLKKLPNYEQKKKEQFYKLKKEYEDELKKDFPDRSDERVILLRDELCNFARTFQAEL